MAISINTGSAEVAHYLDHNDIHHHINHAVLDVVEMDSKPSNEEKPNLDLLFLLPDNRDMLDYERVSLESFNSGTKTLKIECLIPKGQLESLATADYLSRILKDAVELAGDFFSFQRIAFQRDEYLTLIEVLKH